MCIFCKIINKEIPASIIYEDSDTLAFLDLSQVTKGHTLVVSKHHSENLLEMDPNDLTKVIQVTQMLAKRISERLNAKGIHLLNNTHAIAGQTIMHTHFHIIPRYSEADAIQIEFAPSALQDLDAIKDLLK